MIVSETMVFSEGNWSLIEIEIRGTWGKCGIYCRGGNGNRGRSRNGQKLTCSLGLIGDSAAWEVLEQSSCSLGSAKTFC